MHLFKLSAFKTPLAATAVGLGLVATALTGGPASAQQEKITLALPGVPPIFGAIFAYIARDEGLYKKYGIEVDLRPMDSGVGAARAVVAGDVDVSMSPTPPVAVMVSNAGVPLKVVSGMEISDWMLGSMDPNLNTCESVKGQAVGVDSPRGARWIQLANMIRPCGLTADKDVPTVNLSANVAQAMVAGQINFGVLHSDDIPVIERESGKKVTIVARVEETTPGNHYAVLVSNNKVIAERRDALVRMAAAHIEAMNMIYDESKWDRIAELASNTGRTPEDAKIALKIFTDMEYWPRNHAGLDQSRIEKAIAVQTNVGKATKGKAGINPEKTPVSHADLTDLSIVEDALKLIAATN